MALMDLGQVFRDPQQYRHQFIDAGFQHNPTHWMGSAVRGGAPAAPGNSPLIPEGAVDKLKGVLEKDEEDMVENPDATEFGGDMADEIYSSEDPGNWWSDAPEQGMGGADAYSIRNIQDWLGGLFQ